VKLAYVRMSKVTPREPQEVVLRAAGFTDWSDTGPVYVDEEPKRRAAGEGREWRARAIAACRQNGGDEVWVATLGVWASTVADALSALEALTARGATLCVASTSRRYSFHPDAADALALAAEIGAANQGVAAAAARASAAKRRAERTEDDADLWKKAERLWADPAVTVVKAAAETGIPLRTLYRHLGRKGTEPFVGGRKRGKGRRK
jgi:DNA invertase Pin-like site-specific DNA recombinase